MAVPDSIHCGTGNARPSSCQVEVTGVLEGDDNTIVEQNNNTCSNQKEKSV